MFTFLKRFQRSSQKSKLLSRYTPKCFWYCIYLLTESLLKFSGGCDIFFILREKTAFCAYLMGSRLGDIFHWLAQAFIFLKSLFKLLADKFILLTTENSGLRIDPYGMPDSILDHEDGWPFNTTLCFLSFKKSVRVLKRLPDMSFCFTLKNTDQTSWPSSKDL